MELRLNVPRVKIVGRAHSAYWRDDANLSPALAQEIGSFKNSALFGVSVETRFNPLRDTGFRRGDLTLKFNWSRNGKC